MPIIIEDFVWIACNVTIMGGVTVGTGSVIGAGSVVMKDIPPHSFAVGVPAKVTRNLPKPTGIPPHTVLIEELTEDRCTT